MAELEEPTNRIDDFKNYFEQVSTLMFGETGTQHKSLANIISSFENLELTSEQKGTIIGELALQTAIQFNKDATSAALDLIRMEPEFELKLAQRDAAEAGALLTKRQVQGYDDNLLLKIVEEQGGLASFAVNAGSDSAQTTINDLKTKMTAVEARVLPLDGTLECPLPAQITPIPTSFVATSITNNSISLSWNPVINATSYLIYKDGILAATYGSVTYIASGLDANTKYAFTVKASINGELSDHTNALVIKTSV